MTATRVSAIKDLDSLFSIIKGNNIDIVKFVLQMDNIDKYMKLRHKIGLPINSDRNILSSLEILKSKYPNIDQSEVILVIRQGPITTLNKFKHNFGVVQEYFDKIRKNLQP